MALTTSVVSHLGDIFHLNILARQEECVPVTSLRGPGMPGSPPSKWNEISAEISAALESRWNEDVSQEISPPQSWTQVNPPLYQTLQFSPAMMAWSRTLQQIRAAHAALRMLEEICFDQMTRSLSGQVSQEQENLEEVSEHLREIRESMGAFQ